jgi:hypothetical protein
MQKLPTRRSCRWRIVNLCQIRSLALTRIPPVHHLLAGHGRRHKNALFMQCPYDLDIDPGNEVCASLLGIDQTKWSICSDITAEQPSFIQLLDHFSFRPSLHGRRVSLTRVSKGLVGYAGRQLPLGRSVLPCVVGQSSRRTINSFLLISLLTAMNSSNSYVVAMMEFL